MLHYVQINGGVTLLQAHAKRLAKAARYSCQECKSKALVHADHSTYYCYRLHIPFCHVAGSYTGGTTHTNSTGVCGISLLRFIAWRD